jgi:peptidoglycan/xylan/chitin deacetylase (PgdA/CDA1 family)
LLDDFGRDILFRAVAVTGHRQLSFQLAMDAWSCLMYHQVFPTEPPSGPGGYFGVSRAQFAEQLEFLQSAGYRAASIEEAAASTGHTVGITFDDSDWTSYAAAFPELAERGMTATFFVITSRVGTPGFATWPELREMKRAGMSIQSHTHSHPFLSTLAPSEVAFELAESKRLLDAALEQDTTGISLPNGDHPRGGALAAAQATGYRWVATSRWGPNRKSPDVLLIRRYTVRRSTTLGTFDEFVRQPPGIWSLEGVRLFALERIRSMLGVSRYARWRRRAVTLFD